MNRKPLVFLPLVCCLATGALADDAGLHSISNVPLYVDGKQSQTPQPVLSPALLDQTRSMTTLGDVLRVLGPAYTAPNDTLRIAHWHFQDGTMLTLWPQGGETLNDPVSIHPRPDCGVAPSDCKDLVLARKKSVAQQNTPSRSASAPSLQSMQPLVGQVQQQRGVSASTQTLTNTLLRMAPAR